MKKAQLPITAPTVIGFRILGHMEIIPKRGFWKLKKATDSALGRITHKPDKWFSMSDNPTSMIGLCQEGKSSPGALRRSAGVNSF